MGANNIQISVFPSLELDCMTSQISLDNILIKNHQGNFTDPIDLEITFSNLSALSHPLEWKIIYFGSAEDEDCDQVLEEFEIPPVDQIQTMKFQLSCQAPDYSRVPRHELLAVTAMILTVSYRSQQFIRVGYYVHYQYVGEELPERLALLPASELVKMTRRTILFDKPRVTKFNISWGERFLAGSESQKEDKHSPMGNRLSEEESQEKHPNEEKQSTVQEKQSRSNNFSDHAPASEPIECE